MSIEIKYIVLCLVFLVTIFIGSGNFSSAQLSSDEQEVLSQSVNSVGDAVKDTTEKIEKAEKTLDNARKIVKKLREYGKISKSKSLELLQGIAEAQYALNMSKGPLKNYTRYSGKVGKAAELYSELRNIQDTYQSKNTYLGQTGGGLAVLSNLADKFGDKIPVPGFREVIQAYGKATGKLLENTVKASKDIQKFRNQNLIGGASYKAGVDREKQEIFERDFPKHAGYHYAPTTPYYVYEAVEGPYARFIWDEEAKQFYPVAPDVPVTMIHRYNLLLDRDMDPKKLKAFSDKWNSIGAPRSKSANQLADLFNGHQINNLPHLQKMAILGIREKYFDQLHLTNTDRDLFTARYIFDKSFKVQVDKSLTELYQQAAGDPRLKDFADYLYKLAKQNNIYVAYIKPVDERQNYNKPRRITDNSNSQVDQPEHRPTPKPTPVPNNNQYRPANQHQEGIDEASKKLKEQRDGQANCAAFMSSLSAHFANRNLKDGSKYWVEYLRPYTYEDGNCVGAHHTWRQFPGKEPYVEVKFYSPEAPAKIPVGGLIKEYKEKYPDAGWAD